MIPSDALHELHATEATYVNDLTLLCEHLRVHATRASKTLSRLWATIGADAETLLQIHLELVRLLRSGSADVSCAAKAFGTMSPYLRVYSQYCSNYVTAQERLEKLRGETVDKALMSLLIKPVQRLCKYPLLLGGILSKLPSRHPSRGALEAAAAAVKSIAEQVNERVRQADGRARFVACANALNQPELVTPGRHLLREMDVQAQVVASCPAPLRGGQRHKCRLWIASDLLILAKVMTRMGSTSYTVLQQGALCHALLTAAPATDAGQVSLRLTTRESRVTSLLWLTTATEAESLLGLFEKAREKAASSSLAYRARALNLIEQHHSVLAELLRTRPVLAESGPSSNSSIGSERSGKVESVSRPALMPWGWQWPRRATKGAGDADDAADTEGRFTYLMRASSGESSALVLAQPLEDLAPAVSVYSQCTARPDASRGGGGDDDAAEVYTPEPSLMPPPISLEPDGEDDKVEEEQTPPCGPPPQRLLALKAEGDFKRAVFRAVRRLSFVSSAQTRLPEGSGVPMSGASQAPGLEFGSMVKELCSYFSNLECIASGSRCFCRDAGSNQSGEGCM